MLLFNGCIFVKVNYPKRGPALTELNMHATGVNRLWLQPMTRILWTGLTPFLVQCVNFMGVCGMGADHVFLAIVT